MNNNSDVYFNYLLDPKSDKPKAIVIHDRQALGIEIAGRLISEGVGTICYVTGDSFLTDWNKNPEKFSNSITILIHKDLGDVRKSVKSANVIDEIRQVPDGQALRTIAISGEFSVKGVSTTARDVLQVDAGYDPGTIEGKVPTWIVDFIALGRVSETEALEFRGQRVVQNSTDVSERKNWLEFQSRHKERE